MEGGKKKREKGRKTQSHAINSGKNQMKRSFLEAKDLGWRRVAKGFGLVETGNHVRSREVVGLEVEERERRHV